MGIKQVSVFIENKKGEIHKVVQLLADHQVDLKALTIADTAKFGILRLIVSNPKEVLQTVKNANYTASETTVIGVEVSDRPGGLAEVLAVMKDNDIGIEYIYSLVGSPRKVAVVIFKVENAEKATSLLNQAGLKLITQEMI